ncbi:MAG: transglycosylase domain-containing protein [Gemmatimonadales bacterium]|nr:transglycosylase domain-containing protein [Gemmatimonadales bacterium]
MRRALTVLLALAALFVAWLFAIWPPPLWYRTHWPRQTAFMAMRAGDTVPVRYRPVPLDSIAPVLQDAVIIGEDNNFRRHGGIDYLALAHALGYQRRTFAWDNPRDRRELTALLPHAWSRRDKLRGASTISQQLAKNLYLSASRNPLRKVKEAVITWRLESALGKDRIMELYLNVVELGRGTWGVEAASRQYFKKGARQLTTEQAAALAGTLPFPLSSNPGYRPGRMRWRQNLILRRLRGEQVEVPTVETEAEPPPPAADSTATPPDSAPAPLEAPPADEPPPADTLPAPADATAETAP